MAKKNRESVEKVEVKDTGIERTKSGPTYVPYTDIIEGENGLTLKMDIPGVTNNDVDIHLEDNILTVTAKMQEVSFDGYTPLYSEYNTGDYERSFRMIEKFDADKIEASLKNGVLDLWLPKQEKAKPRKIKVKSSE